MKHKFLNQPFLSIAINAFVGIFILLSVESACAQIIGTVLPEGFWQLPESHRIELVEAAKASGKINAHNQAEFERVLGSLAKKTQSTSILNRIMKVGGRALSVYSGLIPYWWGLWNYDPSESNLDPYCVQMYQSFYGANIIAVWEEVLSQCSMGQVQSI